MLLSSLPDSDGSSCTLTYEPANNWLRATWQGFVDNEEAMRGANNYLNHLALLPCSCLLNDNLQLWGPWFDSVTWLQHAWLPHAQRLGLCYVAHVVRPSAHPDVIALANPGHVPSIFEVQLFHDLAEAEHWLRSCPQPHSPPLQMS